MTYNWVVYNKENMEKVGELTTNHSVDLQYALYLLDVRLIRVDNPDDPDIEIRGKKYWSQDLDVLLKEEYDEVANA